MNDINNPLEDIKVEATLRSEKMKLEYRKANKPESINILDYTVIAALEKQTRKKPEKILRAFEYRFGDCPTCGMSSDIHDKYCNECGQKLDWGCEI